MLIPINRFDQLAAHLEVLSTVCCASLGDGGKRKKLEDEKSGAQS
jgi:hypothetical protein